VQRLQNYYVTDVETNYQTQCIMRMADWWNRSI